jgi:hypothetical protein
MTDGTSEFNSHYREGFFYELVKANVDRIVTSLTAELKEQVHVLRPCADVGTWRCRSQPWG